MFNLGYKQVVINDGLLITQPAEPGNQVHIEGFGWFTVGASIDDSKDDHVGAYAAPVLGETVMAPVPPTDWVLGEIWEVKLFFDGTRVLSDMWTRGDTLQFQTYPKGPNAGTFVGELTDGMAAAAEDYPVVFDGIDTFTFKEGYEGITIRRIEARKVDCSLDDRCTFAEDVTGAITEGDEGFGTPRQVEASIRRSTDWSQDPYRIQVGGNESVDFEGEYEEYVWRTKEDHESSDTAAPAVPETPEVLATGTVTITVNAAGDGIVGFSYNGTSYSISPGAADTPTTTAAALAGVVNGGSQLTAVPAAGVITLTALPGSGVGANLPLTDDTTDTTQLLAPVGMSGGVDFVPAIPAIVDAEWAHHELGGFGDANTEATYQPRRYVVYLNTLDANYAAAAALLDSLVVTA